MKRELYMAKTFQDLSHLAQIQKDITKRKLSNKNAEILFHTGLQNFNDGDEERAYIYFVRFLLVYDMLENSKGDNGYTRKILGAEHKTVSNHLLELKSSLSARYKELEIKEHIVTTTQEQPINKVVDSPVITFSSGYITCHELYNLIQNKYDIVMFDARSEKDFQQSSMKFPACVNIPEHIIKSGLSANKLGKAIPNQSLLYWERRWKCSLLILLDWSATRETITTSKLNLLRDILVNWDTSVTNSKLPVILNGGYLEFLDLYPAVCTNPDIVYQVQNTLLNDILDIDTIEYPTTEDSTPATFLNLLNKQPTVDRATKPAHLVEEVTNRQKNLLNQEKEMGLNILQYQVLPQDIKSNRKLENDDKSDLGEQAQEKQDVPEIPKTIKDINIYNKEPGTNVEKTGLDPPKDKDSVSFEAKNEKKPDCNIFVNGKKSDEFTPCPTVDRKSKPVAIKTLVPPGATGLKNFNTTCYMNSVIQCLSNNLIISKYCCNNIYLEQIDRNKTENIFIIYDFADVIKRLWNGQNIFINPENFKNVVYQLAPRYNNKEHQDAHEFLQFLIEWLHDDVKKSVPQDVQPCFSEKTRHWYEQTEGMISPFHSVFYGQISNVITCGECSKSKTRYELFQNIFLDLPSEDYCTLEECINLYFKKTPIFGYACPQCKGSKRVWQKSSIVTYPPVLVIVLKRFLELYGTNSVTYKKNQTSVKFHMDLQLYNVKYNLSSVIHHKGTLGHGHYTSVCKNPVSGKWYFYDDQMVHEVSPDFALNGTEVYIMFFERKLNDAERKHLYNDK